MLKLMVALFILSISASAASAEIFNYSCEAGGRTFPLRVDDKKNTLEWMGKMYSIAQTQDMECSKFGWHAQRSDDSFNFCTVTKGGAYIEDKNGDERADCNLKEPSATVPSAPNTSSYHYVANTRPPDAFLALRTHPSSREGTRIKSMPNKTKLQILQRRNDGWWNVRVVPTGEEGWTLSGQGSRKWIECCTTFDPEDDAVVLTAEELAQKLSAHKNVLAEVEVERRAFQSELRCHTFEYWLKQSATDLKVTVNCDFSYKGNSGESGVSLRYKVDDSGTMKLVDKQHAG